MNTHFFIPSLLFLFASAVSAQETVREVVAPQAEHIKSGVITMVSEQESVLAEDGGYLANPTVVDCFSEMSYQYTGGRYNDETIRFRFRSPDKVDPNKKYPLVIWLHGAGESGNDNQRQLAHMQSTIEFLAGSRKLDFYILATQCPADNRTWDHSTSSEGKGDAPVIIVQEILDQIVDTFPIDRNRISVVGMCSGGVGAWSLLKAKPNFFSAVVVFAASPPSGLLWNEHCQGTSLWAFNNNQDESVPVEPMRRFVDQINQSGGLAYVTVRDGGHDTHTKAMRKDKVVAWIMLQDRTRIAPPPGLTVYAYNNFWRPFFLFALPILLSILLLLLLFLWQKRLSKDVSEKH